jgi:putative flippase GtrA
MNKLTLLNNSITSQSTRYILVGLGVFICDYLTFAVMSNLTDENYLLSNVTGRLIGAIIGFFLHKHITFTWDQKDGVMRQVMSYLLLFATNVFVSTFSLWVVVEYFEMNSLISRLLIDVCIIILTFSFSRLFVYRSA